MKKKIGNNIMCIFLITVSFMLGNHVFADSTPKKTIAYQTVRVRSGDTLWSLAAEYTDQNTDIRHIIYEIKEINNIGDAGELQPGILLQIPITNISDSHGELYIADNKKDL